MRIRKSKALALSAIVAFGLWVPVASAAPAEQETAQCIAKAASAFNIPDTPLWVILDVERGQVGRVSRNTNGTYDIGPMQINSIWLSKLRRFGISRDDLLYNRCINIYVAAWIFTQEYNRLGGDLGKAIAHYHSPTPKHQRRYLGLVQQAIRRRIAKLEKATAIARSSTVAPTIATTAGAP